MKLICEIYMQKLLYKIFIKSFTYLFKIIINDTYLSNSNHDNDYKYYDNEYYDDNEDFENFNLDVKKEDLDKEREDKDLDEEKENLDKNRRISKI